MASVTDIGTITNPLAAPYFGGPTGWAAAIRDALNSSDVSVDTRIANHAAAADPHPTYLQTAEGDSRYSLLAHTHAGTYDPAGTASSAVAAHAGAADPHTGYQKESEKGAVSGYASLDGTGKVPVAQLPAMGVSDHGALTGLLDDDHTQYQLRTEKGAANGYASLGADGKVPAGQVGIVASPPEVSVEPTEPVAQPDLVLWVDPNDFQGDSGWQGFDARYVNVIGDAMTGPLAMGSQKITGLANAVDPGDAMNQQTGDGRYLTKAATGAQTVTGPVTFTGLTTVPTPALAGEAANKSYVDGRVVVAASAPASPATGQLWATP